MYRRNQSVWIARALQAGVDVSALCDCTLLVTVSEKAFQFKMYVDPYPAPEKYRPYTPYSFNL